MIGDGVSQDSALVVLDRSPESQGAEAIGSLRTLPGILPCHRWVYHGRLLFNEIATLKVLRRFYPVAAFLCGFVWDALTIGQRVRVVDLWRLGAFLFGAGLLILWLASRESRKALAPAAGKGLRGCLAGFRWQAPYLLLQFFFGGIFSALFILYFKSSGHLVRG